MSNGEVMIIVLIVTLIKKMLFNEILLNEILSNPEYKISQYFPNPYSHLGRNVKVELDLPDDAARFKRSNKR